MHHVDDNLINDNKIVKQYIDMLHCRLQLLSIAAVYPYSF